MASTMPAGIQDAVGVSGGTNKEKRLRALPRRRFGSGSGGPPAGEGSDRRPLDGSRMGVLVLVASITMMFAGFTSTLLARRAGADWIVGPIPSLLWMTSAAILISGGTVEWARARIRRSDFAGARQAILVTAGLAAVFVVGQVMAWRQLISYGIHLSTSAHAGFFYVLTGAHALHVFGGLVALILVWFRIGRAYRAELAGPGSAAEYAARHRVRSLAFGHPVADDVQGAVTNFAIYWHFMAGLWIYLFIMLFVA